MYIARLITFFAYLLINLEDTSASGNNELYECPELIALESRAKELATTQKDFIKELQKQLIDNPDLKFKASDYWAPETITPLCFVDDLSSANCLMAIALQKELRLLGIGNHPATTIVNIMNTQDYLKKKRIACASPRASKWDQPEHLKAMEKDLENSRKFLLEIGLSRQKIARIPAMSEFIETLLRARKAESSTSSTSSHDRVKKTRSFRKLLVFGPGSEQDEEDLNKNDSPQKRSWAKKRLTPRHRKKSDDSINSTSSPRSREQESAVVDQEATEQTLSSLPSGFKLSIPPHVLYGLKKDSSETATGKEKKISSLI